MYETPQLEMSSVWVGEEGMHFRASVVVYLMLTWHTYVIKHTKFNYLNTEKKETQGLLTFYPLAL